VESVEVTKTRIESGFELTVKEGSAVGGTSGATMRETGGRTLPESLCAIVRLSGFKGPGVAIERKRVIR
jgi:hypothetical protein